MGGVRRGRWLLGMATLVLLGCGQQAAEEPLSDDQLEPVGEQLDDEDDVDEAEPAPSEGSVQPADGKRVETEEDVQASKVDRGESESQADAASEPTDPQRETTIVELPYREPDDDGLMPSALLWGTLAADRDFDGGCLWVAHEDGEVTPVLWNRRYRMRFPADGRPAELLDDTGTVVAREGDVVELGGGSVGVWGPLERCHVGDRDHVWWGWFEQ